VAVNALPHPSWIDVRYGFLIALAVAANASADAQAPSQRELPTEAQREVAVTFDDLPVVTRAFRDVDAQRQITEKILAAIRRHEVPAIGFVNEGKLAPAGSVDDRRVDLLRQWIDAGLELGNHTRSHVDLHAIPVSAYLADIARGDSVTTALLPSTGRRPRYFRHPYLRTGRDLGTRREVERFLGERGYRVAPVTIDNNDYIFATAYERALVGRDEVARHRIAAAYLDYMTRVFAYYEHQSVALFGREVRQVLLLHANALNADHFGALAEMMARRGYRFVSLDHALADPAYGSDDQYTGPSGISWLHRWALTQGKRGAFFAGEPEVPEAIAREAAAR
jgi:peptidoglycan/xylan/chitin deacetylase (PgdA/CDA1 family)